MRLGSPVLTIPDSPRSDHWESSASIIGAVHASACIVEMDPWEAGRGELALPSEVQERLRPTSGTVLACGAHWAGSLNPGDRVIVKRDAGLWIDNFGQAIGQVRIYGPISPNARHYVESFTGVYAVIESAEIRAIRDKVLIRKDPCVSADMGLFLPDDSKHRPPTATVVSAGPDARLARRGDDASAPLLESGDRVVYNQFAADHSLSGNLARYGLDGAPNDYSFIRAADIYCVLKSETGATA